MIVRRCRRVRRGAEARPIPGGLTGEHDELEASIFSRPWPGIFDPSNGRQRPSPALQPRCESDICWTHQFVECGSVTGRRFDGRKKLARLTIVGLLTARIARRTAVSVAVAKLLDATKPSPASVTSPTSFRSAIPAPGIVICALMPDLLFICGGCRRVSGSGYGCVGATVGTEKGVTGIEDFQQMQARYQWVKHTWTTQDPMTKRQMVEQLREVYRSLTPGERGFMTDIQTVRRAIERDLQGQDA